MCAALLAELLPRATPTELLGGLHAWRALAQADGARGGAEPGASTVTCTWGDGMVGRDGDFYGIFFWIFG